MFSWPFSIFARESPRASPSATRPAGKEPSGPGKDKAESPKPGPAGTAESGPADNRANATAETEAPPRRLIVRSGSVLGMSHVRKFTNNQDALLIRALEAQGKQYLVGLVADGCSGAGKGRGGVKTSTEVGSQLLAMFAFSEIRSMLSLGVPLLEIPKNLYPRCVGYVGSLARLTINGLPNEHASFISNFCLCTLLGFVADDSKLITFASGDGFFIVNDRLIVLDANNAALYLGYHQVDRQFLSDLAIALPETFGEVNVYDVVHLRRFAVGTDGLLKRDDKKGAYLDPEEVDAMFGYQPTAQAGLQWWLRKAQGERQRFEDDTTAITLNRESEVPNAVHGGS